MINGKAMDLGDIVETDSAELELKHPSTGAPTGIFIMLAGPEHPARREYKFATQRDMRKRMARMKGSNIGKLLADIDPEDDESKVTDYLVTCTLGWRQLQINGEDVAFTPNAARSLYNDPRRAYVRRQVIEFLDEAENFIASSPTRS